MIENSFLKLVFGLLVLLSRSSHAWVIRTTKKHQPWGNHQTGRLCVTATTTTSEETTTDSAIVSSIQEQKRSVVTIDCKLVPVGDFVPEPLFDGIVLDAAASTVRLSFVEKEGNYLPGLHSLVASMDVGESKNKVVIDAGYGERNPAMEATVKFADAGIQDKSQIQPGVQLQLANGMKCTVTSVTEDTFTMDGNHPMAGASYETDVTLISRDQGPDIKPFTEDKVDTSHYSVATFALGCFWGVELAYMREPGVVGTSVGYTQGSMAAPTYQQVCEGTTGHTEAVTVTYDSREVSYERLVKLAMERLGKNMYLLNQVGNDRGTQYRHGVYYHNEEQKLQAESVLSSFGEDCKTECLPAEKFWVAEDYHQQYLLKGGQSARKEDDSLIRCYG